MSLQCSQQQSSVPLYSSLSPFTIKDSNMRCVLNLEYENEFPVLVIEFVCIAFVHYRMVLSIYDTH